MPWFKPKPAPVFYNPMWIDGDTVIIGIEDMFVSCRGEEMRPDDRMILRFLGLLSHFYERRDMLDMTPRGQECHRSHDRPPASSPEAAARLPRRYGVLSGDSLLAPGNEPRDRLAAQRSSPRNNAGTFRLYTVRRGVMTATDYADRNGHSVTICVKALGIPANQTRGSSNPELHLLWTFVHLAAQQQLVDAQDPGKGISPDGRSFHFTINQTLYAGYQEEKLSDAYLTATERQLCFELPPEYDEIAEAASDSIDWGGIVGGAARFLGRLLD